MTNGATSGVNRPAVHPAIAGIAAIPASLALLATQLDSADATRANRFLAQRAAVTNVVSEPELDESEQGFLDVHNPHGVPVTPFPGHRDVIVREGYSLSHNNVDKIADWVSYHLDPDCVDGPEDRTDDFRPDRILPTAGRAELQDYKGFLGVYDRGHQVAAGDSKGRGRRIMSESFLLSNMTPQSASLNRGGWRSLEMKVQGWARTKKRLWVITGPAFVDENADGLVEYFVIGGNHVAVPTHYYKIVLHEDDENNLDALAFLIPNEKMQAKADAFLVSIDEVERVTGYDFFPNLENSIENTLESEVAEELWN